MSTQHPTQTRLRRSLLALLLLVAITLAVSPTLMAEPECTDWQVQCEYFWDQWGDCYFQACVAYSICFDPETMQTTEEWASWVFGPFCIA